jgi:GAF domain-containing protein
VAEEPPVARDPAEIAATLGELGCLDLVELGQQAVLERIVQAAATCCGSTGGVGLLLLNPDQQLHYVAAAGRPRRSLAGSQVRLGEGPSVDAFLQDAPVASRHLAGEPRWPNFRPLALAAGIRAWLSAPVRQRHGPIGAGDFARIEQARDLIMERERLDEVARSSCCASRPRSRGSPSEPSPNASFPAPELDLHLPSSPPRWVAGGGHRTAAPPRARARQSR